MEELLKEDGHEKINVDFVTAKAMGIPLILNKILKMLPTTDLLSCSLVNCYWNSASREVLRKHRICLAHISESNPDSSIKNLNDLLENSSNQPFNGLAVSTEISNPPLPISSFQPNDGEDPSQLLTNLFSNICFKNLRVSWSEDIDCPSVSLIKKILQDYPEKIEHLYLHNLPKTIKLLSKYFGYSSETQHMWFPNLKTLQVNSLLLLDRRMLILQDILASAPNLQGLVGNVCPESSTLNHFSLVNLDELDYTFVVSNLLRMQPSHLKKLTISGVRFFAKAALPKHLSTLDSLWKYCSMSLNELEINHLDLIVLSTAGFPPLPHVSMVTFTFNEWTIKYAGMPKLRCIDFPRMFPKLKIVKVHPSFYGAYRIWANDMIVSNRFNDLDERFVCRTVTTFILVSVYDDDIDLRGWAKNFRWTIVLYMAKIFPAVKHLTLRGCPIHEYFCQALWTSWNNLESICLTSVRNSSFLDVELSIIGISGEEWKYWQSMKQDIDFDKFQFAPVRSCLRNCSTLKKLRIEFTHLKSPCLFESSILSELSGACGFSRNPNLQVEIVRSKCSGEHYYVDGIKKRSCCGFALDTLAPYVRFVNAEPSKVIHPRE